MIWWWKLLFSIYISWSAMRWWRWSERDGDVVDGKKQHIRFLIELIKSNDIYKNEGKEKNVLISFQRWNLSWIWLHLASIFFLGAVVVFFGRKRRNSSKIRLIINGFLWEKISLNLLFLDSFSFDSFRWNFKELTEREREREKDFRDLQHFSFVVVFTKNLPTTFLMFKKTSLKRLQAFFRKHPWSL